MRRLDDLKKLRISLLVKLGGFSHRAIAHMVFGTPLESQSENSISDRRCVSAYCSKEKLRVSDWRNCQTAVAQQHARTVMQVKKSVQKRLAGRRRHYRLVG